jgi:hypothetical protein
MWSTIFEIAWYRGLVKIMIKTTTTSYQC